MATTTETRKCSECGQWKDASDFSWTYDRYGNPWKKVCDSCHEKVSREIADWKFDPDDAGEALEPEDY
jgi:hypothetical protein